MAKFNNSIKAKQLDVKRPLSTQLKNKPLLILTIINTILLIYLTINK